MKRFTSLMLMLLFAVTTWAGPTDLPELTTDANIKWYTIKNVRTNKYATYAGDNATMTQQATASGASFFYFTASTTEGAVKIHNYSAGSKLCAKYNSWTDGGIDWFLKAQSTGVSLCTSTGEWDAWNDARGEGQLVEYWSASDAGSAWAIELVTDFSSVIDLPAAKDAAKTTLNNIKGVTVLFDGTKIDAAIEAVEAVVAKSNSLEDLNAAVESVNAIVANIYTENFTNKNVRFTTQERGVADITAVAAGGAAQNNSGDAGIWTLKAVKGGFKMYNFASNLWLGATRGQSQRVPTVEKEDDAALYVVNSRNGNEINLWNNGNTLHVDGSKNLVQWNDNAAGGGIFVIAEEGEISVTRDVYVNANAAKTTLPYAIQQAYGLVTDASNYYSNHKSTVEGSYEALLDNVETTYFHSAYGDEQGDDTHYIQANLGENNSIDEFYFYMKPRSGNGNNRPVNITVSGSNDNEEFTEIAKVTTTLDGSMTPYISAKLGTDGTNYQYIRLTVDKTNTNTVFFTLSELYLFPATNDVTNLVEAYTNLASTSITSADYATYANALVNAETTLALANIKKEVNALIQAANHNAVPALGEYTTAAYNALVAAYNDASATQESLEAAIAAFKKAKNSPVFTISGSIDYVVGKSMYEDEGHTNAKGNDLYFKTTNKYDKTMWWVFDQTTTTVGVTESVAVMNYATGNPVWGVEKLKIAETSDAVEGEDDGIFLFYTVGNTTPLHFQKDGSLMTRWSSTEKTSGSAVTFTYVGNTYDLDQLTDEKIAALAALQAAYNAKAVYANAEMGEGLGQYKGNKEAIVTALAAAEVIGSKTLAQQAVLNIADINAATIALNSVAALEINMPAAGKYYRIQGACEAVEGYANYYITGHTNDDGGRIALTKEADASTIYYFDGTNLIAYQSGLVIGLNNAHWTFASIDDNSKPASKIEFAQSPRTAGAYTVKSADRYLHYFYYSVNNTVQVNRCEKDECNEHDWYLTEVTSLPVTISSVKHATFYAPVAVKVADGVTAHTVTINEGGWADLNKIESGVIPANTGVILTGEATDYSFEITTADAFEGENLMDGTIAKTLVAKPENTECYVLAVDTENGLGMYAAAKGEDRKIFYNAGHKAYLAVSQANPAAYYSFRFEDGTTAIENVEVENEVKAIYDLTGRRVEAITAPGIYIVNGKKVLVK